MTLAPFRATAEWTVATIAPSNSWDGTVTWVGRTVPTESGSAYGSGWTKKTIGGFDTPPYQWLTADTHVGVVCDHGDSSWIDYVEFWCEGSTTRVYRNGYNPDTGAIGYFVKVQPPAGTDGDADIYAKIVPVNGYERLVGPLRMILNKGGSIARTVKTVKTSGGDYSTVTAAVNAAVNGWIIKVDAGTWADDTEGSVGSALTRGFEIRPADGVSASQVIITRSTRGPMRSFKRNIITYRNLTFATEKINVYYDQTNRIFIGCRFIDANGANPAPGYQISDLTTWFRCDENQITYLVDCEFRQPQCAGWKFARNTNFYYSADACTIRTEGNADHDYVIINCRAQQNGNYAGRRHVPSSLTVSTVSYSAGTGRTTITLSGSPSMDNVAGGGATTDDTVFILTGALAGNTYALYSQDDTTDTVVLTGNASSLVAGDTLWTGNLYHCDTFQTFGGGSTVNYYNLIAQRYWTTGTTYQPVFLQTSNGTSTQKDIAFQLCIFDATTYPTALSQYQNQVENVVMRQCTHIGSNMDLRDDMSYWSASGVVFYGCIFRGFEATGSGGNLPTGCTASNCHFASGSSWNQSNASTGASGLGSDYRPTAGSAVLAGCTTKFPFDYYLNRWTGTVAKGACKEVS